MKTKYLVILILISNILYSQTSPTITINWNPPIVESSDLNFLSFENANYNEDFLPIYNYRIKVNETSFSVQIIDKVFEELSDQELKIIDKNLLKNSIEYHSTVSIEKFQKYLTVNILPIRYNINSQKVEKLMQFSIQYTPNTSKSIYKSTANSINSEMSSGNWLKIGVVKTGVYKITYDELVQAGISSPNTIRVYGYGGGNLPEYNTIEMPDDMNELSISIQKGSNQIFDSGDYFMFYAEGPLTWSYIDSGDYPQFFHEHQLYSDTIFYFISSNTGASKELAIKNQNTGNSSPISVYLDHAVHEQDLVNLLHSGKRWFGEEYNSIHENYDISFNFPDLVTDSLVKIETFCSGRYGSYSYLNVFYGNQNIQSLKIPNVDMSSYTSYYVRQAIDNSSFKVNSSSFTLSTKYDQYEQYNAWLDYISVCPVRQLKVNDQQLNFTNIYNKNGVNEYQISGTNPNYLVWDVTNFENVQQLNIDNASHSIQFKDDASEYRTYHVFEPGKAYKVASKKLVRNQNLHSLKNIEYVILTPQKFKTQAEAIANFHRTQSNLSTIVVTNEEVYNEFSSGTPDITAIKNFMRHLYQQRSFTDTLKYLLLFGDGSYDNKSQSSSNTNYILTYQSEGSIKVSGTYVCDDYYGLLDDSEGGTVGYLDIGIGRLPIKNTTEANNAVQKITNYNSNPESYGNWRSSINFVADNGDGNLHINDADDIADLVETNYPKFNLNKIYIDAYPLEESAGGDIVPEATHAFNNAINQGTLFLNYTGHGGELGLAHEQLISIQDILSWNNANQLATFMTATCEFTRYDDKNRTSAGEQVFLNPNGGGIALFTTTRIAYAGPNKIINTAFFNQLFDDNTFRMGDLIRRTKNALGNSSQNMRIFTLIGDPALSLAIPKINVSTLKINNATFNDVDTFNISPLSKVTIEGEVQDLNNQLVSDFNGIVYPTVYDKADTILTLCQLECMSPVPFKNRKNIIYKGKASVNNGKFSFSFIVPKDISYKNGLGRISYYAENKITDGWGFNNKLSISGVSDTNIVDQKGPEIELFINDEAFIYGGTTDENPIFIANLFDENGINTVGNGIGHDLTAKLDDDNKKLSVLNTYYESDLDDYQSGKIKYPYSKISDGKHQIYFKAWDVFNNSSEQTIEFIVAESNDLAIKNIFNYPNPFTTNTDFYFDHNQANKNLDVIIQIFTISGKLVKTIETNILSDGFRSTPIHWNGKDDFNDNIGKGVYIYKLKVKTPEGQNATEFQKLVILK